MNVDQISERESLVVREAIKIIKAGGEAGKGATLFSSNTQKSEDGGFQIYPCTQSPSGDVTLAADYKLKKHPNISSLPT